MEKTYPTAWHIVSKDEEEKELAEHKYVWVTKGTQTMSFTGTGDSKVRCGEGRSKLCYLLLLCREDCTHMLHGGILGYVTFLANEM